MKEYKHLNEKNQAKKKFGYIFFETKTRGNIVFFVNNLLVVYLVTS
jgi:hypothetical protein